MSGVAAAGQEGQRAEPTRLRMARLTCAFVQPFGAGKLGLLLYPYERGKRDGYKFTVRAKTGSMFTGSTADFHAHPFAVIGCSTWRNWAIALAVCRPGDVIVEIGANVGTETVGFSDIVGTSGRVLAFEPLPAHRETLPEALGGLRHPNVTVFPYALSESEGLATFATPSASMSQGIGHLLGPDEQGSGRISYNDRPVDMGVTEVETRPLDQFAAELRGLRLVVADAEGSELPILRAQVRFWRTSVQCWCWRHRSRTSAGRASRLSSSTTSSRVSGTRLTTSGRRASRLSAMPPSAPSTPTGSASRGTMSGSSLGASIACCVAALSARVS